MGRVCGGRRFICKNHVAGIFILVLYVLGVRPRGPSSVIAGVACGTLSNEAPNLPASGTKETSGAGLLPWRAGLPVTQTLCAS